MEDRSPFDLTDKQKVAFKKLEAAYKACLKEGIYFVNNYGNLQAYNKKWVEDYADYNTYGKNDADIISTHDDNFWCPNNFKIVNEWTDDEHRVKLTPLGKKMYDNHFDK